MVRIDVSDHCEEGLTMVSYLIIVRKASRWSDTWIISSDSFSGPKNIFLNTGLMAASRTHWAPEFGEPAQAHPFLPFQKKGNVEEDFKVSRQELLPICSRSDMLMPESLKSLLLEDTD